MRFNAIHRGWFIVLFLIIGLGNFAYAQEEPSDSINTEIPEEAKIEVSAEEALELLKFVQTKKDYDDAVQLIQNAKNARKLKKNEEIKEIVLLKSKDFTDVKAPIWAESLWGIIIMSFTFGITALLTPCVFPLIPMTVTFFMKDGKSTGIRKAITYGISIVVIFVVFGVIISKTLGAAFANQFATNMWLNLGFFALFMVFAASFLGMFEITLPSKFVNSIDRQADKGGFLGPFFMAFTLVVVSFSCTGPIVGTVLFEAQDGEILKPTVAMIAFGSAIAIPFTLFAIFPEWLGNLPKSGGWLNSVKVVLGFVEIALGLKFFSVADQVEGWEILDREFYLALWIVIFSMIGFYLLGKFKLPNDSDTDRVGVPRLILSLLSFSFVVYMIPGLWGAQLKELSGYLPPMSTQEDYHVTEDIVRRVVLEVMDDRVKTEGSQTSNQLCMPSPKYHNEFHLPHGLKGYFDLKEALECSKQQQKPLFIDFTGHGCVNCRAMEQSVWKDPRVLSRLRKDYIVVALYCDDRKVKLKESEYLDSKIEEGEKLTNLGEINSEYQQLNFYSNSQPLYVLMGPDGKKLPGTQQRNYDLDVDAFVRFLDEGKKVHEQLFKNN